MIGFLRGKVLEIIPPVALIDVAGIGYEVNLPLSHITQLESNQEVSIYTHFVVREDAHSLYGFLLKSERDCYRQLIKVSGVGPKIGLALLSTMNSQQLQSAIGNSDIPALSQAPGVGKKMAERMVLELKGKIGHSDSLGLEVFANSGNMANNSVKQDIANALESLGYGSKEINQILKQLGDVTDITDGIKQALQLLSKF